MAWLMHSDKPSMPSSVFMLTRVREQAACANSWGPAVFTRFGSYVRLGDVLFAMMDVPSRTCALHGPGRFLGTNDRDRVDSQEKEMLWWGSRSNVELSRRRPGQPRKMMPSGRKRTQ
jgi:hypothetical protein